MTKLTPQPRRKVIKAIRKLGYVYSHSKGGHDYYIRESDETVINEYVLNLMTEDTSVEEPIVYLKQKTNQIMVDKGVAEVVEIVPARREIRSVCMRGDTSSSCSYLSKDLKKTKGNIMVTLSLDESDEINLITYSRSGIEEKFYNWHNIKSSFINPKEREVSISYINGKRIKIEGEFINLMYISNNVTIFTAPPNGIVIYPFPPLNEPIVYSITFIDIDGDNVPDIEVGYDDYKGGYYWYSLIEWKDYENKQESYIINIFGSHKKDEIEQFRDSENIHERIMYLIYKSGILEEFLKQYPPPGV